MKLRIGEFSLITSLSIKTLRLYHEKGLLIPAEVDDESSYRFYDEASFETARAIVMLRDLGFPLAEIRKMLEDRTDEDLRTHLEARLKNVQSEIGKQKEVARSLASLIEFQKEETMDEREFEIEEIEVETVLIAGHRMTGRYQDVPKGLQVVCRKMGRHMNGKPMTLYYDAEYKEEGADFEPCVPVRKGQDADGISVRELKGGRCLSLLHRGPYETLRNSYGRIFAAAAEKGYEIRRPTREIYRKGPGILFKGKAKNYLTEIQVPIEG